ncbi:MAG: transglycosylase domain-containing protein [Magnetospirillum sp.]|nr:transglycosylase domain-containing protein [Magnetospirillum sp.]
MRRREAHSASNIRPMPRPSLFRRAALALTLALPLLSGLSAPPPARAMDLFGDEFRTVDDVLAYNRGHGVRFLDRQGRFIGSIGETYGDTLTLEKLPKHLIQALIAKEDRRYLEHDGIDFQGLARALAVAVTSGRFSQGGSTLTQQTMKLIFLNRYNRWSRKAYELYSASDFEESSARRTSCTCTSTAPTSASAHTGWTPRPASSSASRRASCR